MSKLNSKVSKLFREALVEAFTENELDLLVSDVFEKRLEVVVAKGTVEHLAAGVIRWAEQRGLTTKLLDEVVLRRPENAAIKQIHTQHRSSFLSCDKFTLLAPALGKRGQINVVLILSLLATFIVWLFLRTPWAYIAGIPVAGTGLILVALPTLFWKSLPTDDAEGWKRRIWDHVYTSRYMWIVILALAGLLTFVICMTATVEAYAVGSDVDLKIWRMKDGKQVVFEPFHVNKGSNGRKVLWLGKGHEIQIETADNMEATTLDSLTLPTEISLSRAQLYRINVGSLADSKLSSCIVYPTLNMRDTIGNNPIALKVETSTGAKLKVEYRGAPFFIGNRRAVPEALIESWKSYFPNRVLPATWVHPELFAHHDFNAEGVRLTITATFGSGATKSWHVREVEIAKDLKEIILEKP
jgi:hypothetical protein